MTNASPYLLIGLGNPGTKYVGNRHNVGFMAVDEVAREYSFPKFTQRMGGLSAEGKIGDKKTILFKPLSFMNLSGQPAGELARFYKIPAEQVFIFHDELDVAFGKLRVKQGGGHGGHNGLKSLDSHIGQNYWRVRLGIGHPGVKELVSPYVLSDFTHVEKKHMEIVLKTVTQELPLLLKNNSADFMNNIARTLSSNS